MSNRFMAPVYALLISFGTALVLGAVMNHPSAPRREDKPESPGALTIHLIAKQDKSDDVLPIPPGVNQVHLHRAKSDSTLAVGQDGTVELTPVDGSLTVCVSLPEDWTAEGALKNAPAGQACWELKDRTGTVPLTVVKGG